MIFNLNIFDLKIQNLVCSYLFININSKIYVMYKFQMCFTKIKKFPTLLILYIETRYFHPYDRCGTVFMKLKYLL